MYGMPKLMDPQIMDRPRPTIAKLDVFLTLLCEFDKKWGNHTLEECYNHMDKFAEMLMNGEDPEKVMPLVKHHLELCGDCREEFDALSVALAACEESED